MASSSVRLNTEPRPARNFRLAIVLPVLAGMLLFFLGRPSDFARLELLAWAAILAVVELFPVPAWRGLQLSLGFPIRLGLAMLYPPAVAAGVALLGTFDPREIRRERGLLPALFDRSQIALAVFVESAVFRSLASVWAPRSPWYVLIPVVLLATAANYLVNAAVIAVYMKLASGLPLRQIVDGLRLGSLAEFLLSYAGLSFAGSMIARLYVDVDMWAVAVFVLPLVFARQMFFRTMALEKANTELTDRKKVLWALSNQMAEERHDERMQIAAYLHDDLAQMLFRLTLQVEMAKKRLVQNDIEAVSKDLDGINTTKQQASEMVRALIRDLHRSPIGRAGLGEALHSFAVDAGARFETPIMVDVQEPTLPPPIQLLIYQIAREAAMNALKHAEAQNVWITLHESDDGVELDVRDDGKGFDTEAPPPEGHFGSVMMRERALVAGGTFAVSSELGKGSKITARFPRVWVEEAAQEADESDLPPEASRVPIGSSTATPATPLNPPKPTHRLRHGLGRWGRAREPEPPNSDKEALDSATAAVS